MAHEVQDENHIDERSIEETRDDTTPQDTSSDRLTLPQLMGSAFAAGIGVQSSRNRKRDFAKGTASQFIVIGVVFTILFVAMMVTIVNLVLP